MRSENITIAAGCLSARYPAQAAALVHQADGNTRKLAVNDSDIREGPEKILTQDPADGDLGNPGLTDPHELRPRGHLRPGAVVPCGGRWPVASTTMVEKLILTP